MPHAYEPVYVVPGSDAEAHLQKGYPLKTMRRGRSSLHPRSIAALLAGLPLIFQQGVAGKLDATYHFRFTGRENVQATLRIRFGKLTVELGLNGSPSIPVTAYAEIWLGDGCKFSESPPVRICPTVKAKVERLHFGRLGR